MLMPEISGNISWIAINVNSSITYFFVVMACYIRSISVSITILNASSWLYFSFGLNKATVSPKKVADTIYVKQFLLWMLNCQQDNRLWIFQPMPCKLQDRVLPARLSAKGHYCSILLCMLVESIVNFNFCVNNQLPFLTENFFVFLAWWFQWNQIKFYSRFFAKRKNSVCNFFPG